MATTNSCDYQLGQSAYDMGVSSVPCGTDNFSTVEDQDAAVPTPVGSQLSLLNAATAGNLFLNYNRTSNLKLAPLYKIVEQQGLGYNTLIGKKGGNFATMGSAYGQ